MQPDNSTCSHQPHQHLSYGTMEYKAKYGVSGRTRTICIQHGLYVTGAEQKAQNGRHFADDIFKINLLFKTCCISIQIVPQFVTKCHISIKPALIQILACRLFASNNGLVYWRIYTSFGLNNSITLVLHIDHLDILCWFLYCLVWCFSAISNIWEV